MANIEGLSIDLGLETTALNRGLTGLKDKLKLVNSEMKRNLSAFDFGEASIEKYQTRLTGLNRKMEVQSAIVEEARKELEKMTQQYGAGSKEADRAAREYNNQVANLNNLQRTIENTTERLQELEREQQEAGSAWGKFKRHVDAASESLTGIGENAQKVGGALTASLTAPISAFGVLAGKTALEFDTAQGRVQAQLGLTREEAEKLGEVAQRVWTQGFGENVSEVGDVIARIGQTMGDFPLDVIEDLTRSSFVLADIFEADVNETTRAASQLIKQFGVDGSDAMDMITAGFQQGGNYSDELLSSIYEYAPQFKNLGFTASQMMGIFISSGEEGIWSLDKLSDAAKESFLQITDGADNTREAIQELGLDYDQITKDIQSGGEEASGAFGAVMTALAEVEDQSARNRLAVELIGTPIEDLGVQFANFFADTEKELKGFEGATKKAADALQDNLGKRAEKAWRGFLKDMEPVGDMLLDIAEEILPKVADVVEDVTDAFSDLSPEGKKTALAVGGIAAAAGPTIAAFGFVAQGAGSLLKVISPLLPAMGEGKGFLGILKKIPGPVGLVATGVGLAAGGYVAYKKAVEKANEVSLEHAEQLLEQKTALQGVSGEYEDLRGKTKLSTDELLRFRDINSELELATTAEEITRLKDEQQGLQEKSGLTNDELAELYRLNDEIVKQAPTVDQAFSDRGNAIIENRDSLRAANDEIREQLRLELETQRIKADASLDQNVADYLAAMKTVAAADKELDASRAERDAQRQSVQAAEIELQRALASGDQARVTIAQNELFLQQGTLTGLETEVGKRADILAEKQGSLKAADAELVKNKQIYDQLINIQLANAGINAKGSEGIAQLDQAIAKNQARINTLLLIKGSKEGLTAEQQKELEVLQQTLGTQQQSKDEISKIKGEQEGVNKKIDEGKKKAQEMTKELSKDTKKNVKVDDKGKADEIHKKAEKDAKKNVWFSWKGLTQKAKDLLGFATGTKNAPGGLAVVGERGPEIMYIPKGSKIIPNNDSKKVFKDWNIPGFQTGGIATRPGIYKLAEDGFSEFIIPTNPSRRSEASKLIALAAKTIGAPQAATGAAQQSSAVDYIEQRQPVLIQLVTPDRREFAKWMIDDINELQKVQAARTSLFERRK